MMEYDFNNIYTAARDFQISMGQQVDDKYRHQNLITEEAGELAEAFEAMKGEANIHTASHFLKELGDLAYVCGGSESCSIDLDEEVLNAVELLTDSVFTSLGDVLSDFIVYETVRRIHESNMSKLDDDGNPVVRESDGKVLKGPNYHKPELDDLAVVFLYRLSKSLQDDEPQPQSQVIGI